MTIDIAIVEIIFFYFFIHVIFQLWEEEVKFHGCKISGHFSPLWNPPEWLHGLNVTSVQDTWQETMETDT